MADNNERSATERRMSSNITLILQLCNKLEQDFILLRQLVQETLELRRSLNGYHAHRGPHLLRRQFANMPQHDDGELGESAANSDDSGVDDLV